jgi:S-methylmethionine-dependent homocysteine/selenocysteine methylase
MSNESKAIFIAAVITIISLFGFITVTSIHETISIVKLVGDGADPIKASCAISGWTSSTGRSLVCQAAAAK